MFDLNKIKLAPSDSLEKVIHIFKEENIGIVIVESNEKLLGIVTDGDVRNAFIKHLSLDVPISKIMNKNPIIVKDGDNKRIAIDLMKKHSILYIPVIDSTNKVVNLEIIRQKQKKIKNPVILMAGGFGKRLHPLTKNKPKPLIKVGKTPILESIIKSFIGYGFDNFYISTHFKADKIREYFNDGSDQNVSIKYLYEEEPLGTAGCLSLLPSKILSGDQPLILMNGDLITETNFKILLEAHIRSNAMLSIAASKYEVEVPYGVIEIENKKVKGILEKPTHQFVVNAGIYVLNPEIIKFLDKNTYINMTDILSMLINQSNSINVFPVYEKWIDIGRKSELLKANGMEK